ncbi:MAG: hypothetical protein ACRD1C_09995 [Terriglobales bacterium]
MKRPATLITIAVLELIGSAFTVLFAALTVAAALLSAVVAPAAGPPPSHALLAGAAAGYCAFAAWGISTAIGLLRMRLWALGSTLVFAGCLLLGGAAMSVALSLITVPGATPQAAELAKLLAALLGAVIVGVASWWIVYCARRQTRTLFYAVRPGGPPQQPFSISIIGWLLAIGGALAVLMSPLAGRLAPVTVASIPFTGNAAFVLDLILGSITFAIGVGVLQLRAWARWAGMAWLALGLANTILTWARPRAWESSLLASAQARQTGAAKALISSPGFAATMLLVGLVVALVPLYYLWTRKDAFEPPAAARAATE